MIEHDTFHSNVSKGIRKNETHAAAGNDAVHPLSGNDEITSLRNNLCKVYIGSSEHGIDTVSTCELVNSTRKFQKLLTKEV